MSSVSTNSNLENISPSDSDKNNDSDNDSSEETDQEQAHNKKNPKKRKYIDKMLYLLREFSIMVIMVLVLISYAAVTNDPPKIGKSPAAYRFFPENTHITDWYRGEISEAINQARSADIAFVMFYAPWDAESQHARNEFQILAKYMHHEITFSAVNCWQPGSECKTQYSKVYKWPVLIAYPTHGRGVQYNGPLLAIHMMQFLKKLINPFVRNEKALDLLSRHDCVIVGKVNSLPFSREYNVFYQTTVRLLERDPFQEIAVLIEPQSPYNNNYEEQTPELRLHLWNETLIYPSYEEWEVEALINWISKHIHEIVSWISPNGLKSLSLANYLQPGPALMLFTPKNPLSVHNDFFNLLREVGHEYHNCGGNEMIGLVQLGIMKNRRDKYLEHLRLTEKCSNKKLKIKVPTSLWNNVSYCLDKKYQSETPFLSDSTMVNYYGGISGLCVELMKNFNNNFNSKKKCSDSSHNEFMYKTSELSELPDHRSPESLRDYVEKETCRTFQIAQKYHQLGFSNELYNTDRGDITGLKCTTNRTLSFVAMDSLYYHHYAEKLGIDLSKKLQKTAVVILDNEMETHYIMPGEFKESNLKNFIYNYTKNSLNRALTSISSVISLNTHTYSNEICSFGDGKFCVDELTAKNFLQTISQKDKAVIIFYYSKQCSFCNGISYRFLTVAKYFDSMKNFNFARIDGDSNLLPWEYTMDSYPTIIIFPPNKISDSRIFPTDLPVTVPNLIGFILANLQPSLKLEVMWNLCRRTEFYSNVSSCNSSLRVQTSSIINDILEEWRYAFNLEEKSLISLKLQHFHDIHTLFMQFPQNHTSVQYHFDQLKFIDEIQR